MVALRPKLVTGLPAVRSTALGIPTPFGDTRLSWPQVRNCRTAARAGAGAGGGLGAGLAGVGVVLGVGDALATDTIRAGRGLATSARPPVRGSPGPGPSARGTSTASTTPARTAT